METYEELRERYENLILQRDRLEKEAEQYRMEYFRQFGELIADVFQVRIDCIALKKSISFCQAKRNAGEEPDPISLQEFIDTHMPAYRAPLEELLSLAEAGKSLTPISLTEAGEIRRIYRRIAKRLHPDIFPMTEQDPELSELFQNALSAYRRNDLKALRETETLINRFLKEHGEAAAEDIIEDLPEKIADLETEIARIIETEPYTYKALLEDPDAIGAKRSELEAEKESYLNYRKELQAHLESLLTA